MRHAKHIFHSLRSISSLGIVGSTKLLLARYFSKTFHIHAKGYPASVAIRGRTSDPCILYNILVCHEYDLTSLSEINHIIDAGANIGIATVFFANAFPHARITSIEPESSNFDLLRRNTSHLPNVKAIRAALWEKRTPLAVVNGESEKWSFQFEPATAGEECEVEGLPMTELVGTGVDLLKIDIEGGEKEIFSTDCDWLRDVRFMFIEIHPGCWQTVFHTLDRFPYDCRLSGENLCFVFEKS